MSNEPERLIIAGGRDFTSVKLMQDTLLNLVAEGWISKDPIIIVGKADGADSIGEYVSKKVFKLEVLEFPANWDDLSEPCVLRYTTLGKPYNALAGMKRNKQMGEAACSLLAFWDGKSKGTKDMIDQMTKAGKRVKVIHYEPEF